MKLEMGGGATMSEASSNYRFATQYLLVCSSNAGSYLPSWNLAPLVLSKRSVPSLSFTRSLEASKRPGTALLATAALHMRT